MVLAVSSIAASSPDLTVSMVRRCLDNLSLLLLASLILFSSPGFSANARAADTKHDIGYTQLVNALGSATPNGAGVPISLVEATEGSGNYMPNPGHSEFIADSDPFFEAINFIDGSPGVASGWSSHATSVVGRRFFGNSSSFSAGANEVTVYEADDWISNVLRVANGSDPLTQNFRVQNFSWIGSLGNNNQDRKALRRFDFMIDRDNVTAVVGLGNNSLDPQPALLVHSYNAIAVGRSNGVHSSGSTLSVYGPGRTKPDIVVPITTTSAATAFTSSAATMLHEVVAGTDAANSEVMKAILLAGATKEEFPGWSRTTTQPLDAQFGAGELNVYNSYLMTQGGQTVGSTDATGVSVNTVDSYGWDYQTVSSGSDLFYNFEIPAGSTAADLSIILNWNVEVEDTAAGPAFLGMESLANLDLTLYDSSAGFLGTQIDSSVSTIDNVEHLYLTDLGPGTYTLQISTDTARDFGLAWRTSTLFDTPSADFDQDGDVDGFDFLIWQGGNGTLVGATFADGDADGDGDVDNDDRLIFNSTFGTAPVLLSVTAAVPEPATVGLGVLAAGLLSLFLRRKR